jgi:hypothetical protein
LPQNKKKKKERKQKQNPQTLELSYDNFLTYIYE